MRKDTTSAAGADRIDPIRRCATASGSTGRSALEGLVSRDGRDYSLNRGNTVGSGLAAGSEGLVFKIDGAKLQRLDDRPKTGTTTTEAKS